MEEEKPVSKPEAEQLECQFPDPPINRFGEPVKELCGRRRRRTETIFVKMLQGMEKRREASPKCDHSKKKRRRRRRRGPRVLVAGAWGARMNK